MANEPGVPWRERVASDDSSNAEEGSAAAAGRPITVPPPTSRRFPTRNESISPNPARLQANTPASSAAPSSNQPEPGLPDQEAVRHPRDAPTQEFTPMMARAVLNQAASVVQVTMPFCSRSGDNYPYFDGSNVTRFLKEFDDLCRICLVPEKERVGRVLRFMSVDMQETSEGFADEEGDDWEAFKEKMRDEFSDRDKQQQMLSKHYLEALAGKRRTGKSDLKSYLQQFHRAGVDILKRKAETDDALCKLFLKGLPEHYASKIVKKMKLNPQHPERADFAKAFEQADKLWNEDFRAARYIQGTAGDINFYELAEEKEGRPSKKKAEQRKERELRKDQYHSYMPISERSPTPVLPVDDGMDELVKRVGAMALPVAANDPERVRRYILDLLKDTPTEAIGLSRINTPAPRQNSGNQDVRFTQPPVQQPRRNSYSSAAPLLCFLCTDQHVVKECPWYQHWRTLRLIHFNKFREICIGKWEGDDSVQKPAILFPPNLTKLQRLEFVAGKIRDELQADTHWKFGESNPGVLPPARAGLRVIRAGGTPNDYRLADSEDETRAIVNVIKLDEAESANVDPKRTAVEQGGRADPKRQQLPQDTSRPQFAQKNTRSNGAVAFDGVTGNSSAIDLSTNQNAANEGLYGVQPRDQDQGPNGQGDGDTEMGDTPEPPTNRQRARALRDAQYGPEGPKTLKNIYSREQNGAAHAVQLALNTPVQIPLGTFMQLKEFRDEFLVKQHWHWDESHKTMIHQPHPPKKVRSATAEQVEGEQKQEQEQVQAGGGRNVPGMRSIHSRSDPLVKPQVHQKASPYLPVTMRGTTEYALLDTGAEINLMTLGLVQEMGLLRYMRKPARITHALGFTGEEGNFVGVIKDVLINVAGVKTPTIFYVADSKDPSFRCILGTPWQAAARMKLEYRDDVTTIVGLSETGREYIYILAHNAPDVMDDGAMDELREIARDPHVTSLKWGAGTNY